MSKSSNCQDKNHPSESNYGFIFGLICGAIIGAIIAVIIYKNNKSEVFEKLEQKIKSFFDNLIPQNSAGTSVRKYPKTPIKKIVTYNPVTEAKEISPIFVKPKKPVPKTFIKPKR